MNDRRPPVRSVSAPLAKFAIGLLGGLIAIYAPRLIAFLFSLDQDAVLKVSNLLYTGVAVAFAFLVAVFIMFKEWHHARPPMETLTAALMLPGLLAGGFNVNVESRVSGETSKQLEQALDALEKSRDIGVSTTEAIELIPIADAAGAAGAREGLDPLAWLAPAAHAAEPAPEATREEAPPRPEQNVAPRNIYQQLSVRAEPASRYLVVLERTETQEAAVDAVQRLQKDYPSAVAGKTNKGFAVLLDGQPTTRFDATMRALEAQEKLGVKAQLLEVAPPQQ